MAYVSGTYIWLNPEYLRWGLPFFKSFPPIMYFLGGIAGILLGLFALWLAGYSVGLTAAQYLAMARGSAIRSVALGWIILGSVIFGLGLCGLWWKPLIVSVLLGAAFAGIPSLIRGKSGGLKSWTIFTSYPQFLLPVTLACWVVVLLSISPEAFQDPLRYHLFIPGQFLTVHKMFFYGDFFFWSYMGPIHMLYSVGLAVAGTSGAKAVNLACAILCLMLLDRIAGRIGLNKLERALLQSLTITAPGWVFVTGSAFMEHGGVLYILLALDSMLDEERKYSSRIRDIFLFAGMAASVKYTAIFGGVGLAMVVLFGRSQGMWERAIKQRWIMLSLLLLAPIIPWAAARWIWTGDPISPILAKSGIPTMDSSSILQLNAAYEFTRGSVAKWLANPAFLFSYPFIFSGSHGGFWEHPGPALVCLLPVVVLTWRKLSAASVSLLWFFGGSVGFWMLFFGGVSPHYIVAYGGIWCAAFLSMIWALPSGVRLLSLNVLTIVSFYQALMMLSASTTGFFPRDVAFGIMTREQYLDVAVVSKRIYRPIRKAIEDSIPDRGVVYSYGDDKGYYLSGKVDLDYDFGSQPLLWRIASDSRDSLELRKRIRQKGWTHMIYATYWPDFYENEGSLDYRFNYRVLLLMQDFWQRYAELAIRAEIRDEDGVKGAYVYAFRMKSSPQAYLMDGGERLPFLPGAEALFLPGDRLMRDGKPDEALVFYQGKARETPGFAVLNERLGRLSIYQGKMAEARQNVLAIEAAGWKSDSLRRLAWQSKRPSVENALKRP